MAASGGEGELPAVGPPPEHSWLTRAIWSITGMNLIAGTASGIAGVFAGHPFDTIKVRLQSQRHDGHVRYRSTLHCLLSIVREERLVGLFKGVTSPLVGVTLMNTLLFGVYGLFLELQEQGRTDTQGSASPEIRNVFVAGALSGLSNSLISAPVELAKIQVQNQVGVHGDFRGPLDCLCRVWRTHGLFGCYRGLIATIWRETPSYGVYFACFEALQRWWPGGEAGSKLGDMSLMLAGGLSGIAGWMSTYPMDVVKTKIQAQPLLPSHQEMTLGREAITERIGSYNGTWSCLRHIMREEGIAGLFRGTTATILRAFPTNAAIFYVYTLTMRGLDRLNPLAELDAD